MANHSPGLLLQKEFVETSLQTFQQWIERPWVPYLMLFLLQLKVMWGIWEYRDLTTGDTAAYFSRAYPWHENFQVNIVWSPLYTAFYGTLLFLSSDAYAVTILHRLIIVFTLTLMVLALMRRLLPHNIAWLIGAWWAILPVNFNPFEVHLFAVIPVLATWLLLLYKPSPWTRGGAVAILFGASILVRNELIIATCILMGFCLLWELRLTRTKEIDGKLTRLPIYLMSYGLPLLAAGLISFFFYTRSLVQFPELPASYAPKHTWNMCQAYAFGYKQRHPEWSKDHWTECGELMKMQFGETLPSLFEMIRKNPMAVAEHVLWNISLVPNGIQVSLFDATSGTVTPDYTPVRTNSFTVLILSIMAGAVLIIGLFLLYQERYYWWIYWLQDRLIGWLGMLSALAVVVFIIIPTQRPRPEYLYPLTIFLMALIGMSIFAVTHRWHALKKISGWMFVVMVIILLIAPAHYVKHNKAQPRRFLELYRRLIPFQDIIAMPNTVFLTGKQAFNVSGYIGLRNSRVLDYGIEEIPPGMSLDIFLNKRCANLFYVDEDFWARAQTHSLHREFLTSPESRGWKLIAFQERGDAKWMLLQRTAAFDQSQAGAFDASLISLDSSLVDSVSIDPQLKIPGWGIEVYDNDRVLWLGQGQDDGLAGALCSTKRQTIQTTFEVKPGPGRSDSQRTVELTLTNEAGSQSIRQQFDEATTLTFTGELQLGYNDFSFTVLDEPTVLKQPNGDTRPLLVLLRHINIKAGSKP